MLLLKSQRLIQLMMVINAKRHFTARELADEFGMSIRTISRDLQELSETGFPIYAVQGRGGGYRLLRERMLPPIAFTESEAMAMFFAGQSLQYFGSLPFGDAAINALGKFYHYLPADVKAQIDRLRSKVAIWHPKRPMSTNCLQTLLQAVMVPSVVTIQYHSSEGVSLREIQPIGIYASQGYWYCPAYCFLRHDYRLFRADRILNAELNPLHPRHEEVERKTIFDWEPSVIQSSDTILLVVKLTSSGVRSTESHGWFGPSLERLEDGGGVIRMVIPTKRMEFFADMVWAIGTDARVEEPICVVEYIKRKIENMRDTYGN